MSKNLRHSAIYKSGSMKIKADLPVIVFEEDGIFYSYCAPLDLYGYGKTEAESKKSFEITLAEFLRYTSNKKTLEKELRRLGWSIKKPKKNVPQYIAPDFSHLVNQNEDLNRILNDVPNIHKYNQTVRIPAFA